MQISPERRGLYYFGMILTGVGLLLFISVFFMGISAMTSHDFGPPKFFINAPIGMVCMIIGQVLMKVGARGAAGSGIVLNPGKAREDLSPWAQAAGGLVKDALGESGISAGKSEKLPFDEQLRRLHQLKVDGLITEAEYQAKRKKILDEA